MGYRVSIWTPLFRLTKYGFFTLVYKSFERVSSSETKTQIFLGYWEGIPQQVGSGMIRAPLVEEAFIGNFCFRYEKAVLK